MEGGPKEGQSDTALGSIAMLCLPRHQDPVVTATSTPHIAIPLMVAHDAKSLGPEFFSAPFPHHSIVLFTDQ